MPGRAILVVGAVLVVVLLMARPAFATKPGALLATTPEMEYARRVLARLWAARGYTLTVTSGIDGTHHAQSLHYVGLAEDYRTRDITPAALSALVGEAQAALGSQYDVILESDHLHVEFDPKGA